LHRQPQAYGLITQRKGETLAADGTPLAASPAVASADWRARI